MAILLGIILSIYILCQHEKIKYWPRFYLFERCCAAEM